MGLPKYRENDHAKGRHKERLNDELGLSDKAISMINLDINTNIFNAVEKGYKRFLVCSNLWIEEDDFWHISIRTSIATILQVDDSDPLSFDITTYMLWDKRNPLENGQLGNDRKVDHFYDMTHKYDDWEIIDGHIEKPVWIKADSEVEKGMKRIAKEWLVKDKDQVEALNSSREHESEHTGYPQYLHTDGFNVDEWKDKHPHPPAYSRKTMKIGGFGFLIHNETDQRIRNRYHKGRDAHRVPLAELLRPPSAIGEFTRKITGLVDFQYHSHHPYHNERSEFIDVTDRKTIWKGRNRKAYINSKSSIPFDIELNNDPIKVIEERFVKLPNLLGGNSIGQFKRSIKNRKYFDP
mgnify:FL=1